MNPNSLRYPASTTPSGPVNDGGPAFPHLHNTCQRVNESEMFPGMTLRDYFTAAALTGLLASSDNPTCRSGTPEGIERERREYAEGMATSALRYADAMLAARGGAS